MLVCDHCKKKPEGQDKLKVCSKCNCTYYCSKECQVNGWKAHKRICKTKQPSITSAVLQLPQFRVITEAMTTQFAHDCCTGNFQGMQTYLSRGGNANDLIMGEGTALGIVCELGFDKCTSLLLKHGANPNLVSRKLHTSPLFMASQNGHDKCVAVLLENGADPDIPDSCLITPLSMASHTGRDKCVSLLLKGGASVDLPDMHGKSPLYAACNVGQLKCALLLIEHGADIHKKDYNGCTILMSCVVSGKPNVISFLLSHGADIHTPNMYGDTAVKYAYKCGYMDCVSILLEHGADESSLVGLNLGSNDKQLTAQIQKTNKDRRKNARYCEYPECTNSNDTNSNTMESSLKLCTRCRAVHYCCVEHQKLHWNEHKKICKAIIQ